ncbi:hypothetical protein [uncultured Culturomica sp.]|uniref:hypothetical protein n=1 Tax=uncultured Culturomica sp. TaxID=1926654 RepID=UPI002599375B|nr:hypothetical protein [uncultured Culturomica sp.]
MKTLFFLLLCFLITDTCYSSLKNSRDSGLEISLLSGNHLTDSVTIYEVYRKSDTLSIVSDDDHLYHPFGQYDTWNDFEKNYIKKHWTNLQTDSLFDELSIYIVRMSPNYIEFVQDISITGKIEIVRGLIYNDHIQLYDGIRVGMTKREFLLNFIKDDMRYYESAAKFRTDFIKDESQYKNISVIEVISVVAGIWYYYFFSPDQILTFICIKTDYTL